MSVASVGWRIATLHLTKRGAKLPIFIEPAKCFLYFCRKINGNEKEDASHFGTAHSLSGSRRACFLLCFKTFAIQCFFVDRARVGRAWHYRTNHSLEKGQQLLSLPAILLRQRGSRTRTAQPSGLNHLPETSLSPKRTRADTKRRDFSKDNAPPRRLRFI